MLERKAGFGKLTKKGAGCGILAKKERECGIRTPPSRPSSNSRLVSKVLNDGLISEVEFNLILRKAERYQSLKNQIRNAPASRSKAHDVEALKEEIKNEYRKKLRSLLNIKRH